MDWKLNKLRALSVRTYQGAARRLRLLRIPADRTTNFFLAFFLVIIGAKQCQISDKQAEIAGRQARISETVERPWVSIENVLPIAPITFKEGTATLTVRFDLRNTGHVPAANVLQTGFFFTRSAAPVELARVWDQCDKFRVAPLETRGSGISIFPDQPAHLAGWAAMPADDVKHLNAQPNVAPTFAGCIDYAFIGETGRHQTRFVYEVDKMGPNNSTIRIVPADGDVPASNVILNVNPVLAGNPD